MTLKSLRRLTLCVAFALMSGVSSLAAHPEQARPSSRSSNISGNQNDMTGHEHRHDKMNSNHSVRHKQTRRAPRRVRRGRNLSPGIRRGRIISNTRTRRNSNTNSNSNMS